LLDTDGNPITSATNPVNLILISDSSNRGSAVPSALGTYETTTPYAKGDRDHNITFKTLSISALPIHWSKKNRGVFKDVPAPGTKLSSDVSFTGNQVYGEIKAGKANLWLTLDATPTNWYQQTTSLTATDLDVKWHVSQKQNTLVMVIVNGAGNIVRYTSTDYGGTWSVAMTLGAGTQPAMCIGPNGAEWYFWRDSSGAIQRIKKDYVGNTIVGPTAVVASGVSDDDISAYYRNGVIVLLYRNTAGNVIVVKSLDMGQTFS